MTENNRLYEKFTVSRKDGRDQPGPGNDRQGAHYFVIDLTYDPHAPAAMEAYADSCRFDCPDLDKDLQHYCDGTHPWSPERLKKRSWHKLWKELSLLLAVTLSLVFGVGRFLFPTHGLSAFGTYEAFSHLFTGILIGPAILPRRYCLTYLFLVFVLTALETVYFLVLK